jgi:hypothetical protein
MCWLTSSIGGLLLVVDANCYAVHDSQLFAMRCQSLGSLVNMDPDHLIAADVADTRAAARRQVAQELENVRRRRESAQLEAEAELDRLGALLTVTGSP